MSRSEHDTSNLKKNDSGAFPARQFVLKFGGSALSDAEGYFAAANAVKSYRLQGAVAVVVSASKGTTDALLSCAELARFRLPTALSRLQQIIDKQRGIAAALLQGPALDDLHARDESVFADAESALQQCREYDQHSALAKLLSCGEKLSANLFSALLRENDISSKVLPAETLIATTDDALHAEVNFAATNARYAALPDRLFNDHVVVIPGFSGSNNQGKTTLLGRNASDYSAAVVARVLSREISHGASHGGAVSNVSSTPVDLIIFGDTDGVYTTDPNRYAFARTLENIAIGDAEWLAKTGAAVIHPRTFAPLESHDVQVSLRATGSPSRGTRFVRNETREHNLITHFPLLSSENSYDKGHTSRPAEVNAFIASCLPNNTERNNNYDLDQQEVLCVLLSQTAAFVDNSLDARNYTKGRTDFDAEAKTIRAALDSTDQLWLQQHSRAWIYLPERHALLILLSTNNVDSSVNFWHKQQSTLVTTQNNAVAVGIIGASGRVGRQVLNLLISQRDNIAAQDLVKLDVVALCNRTQLRVDYTGALQSLNALPEITTAADVEPSQHQEIETARALLHALKNAPYRERIVIDATASSDVADLYAEALALGIAVVTPNKIANAGSQDVFEALQFSSRRHHTPYAFETTVGAALPVLKPIADLRRAGDPVHAISAALSGTIGYVLTRVQQGDKFSDAIGEAIAKGYAEPDPAIDLSGEDVARKLLVLLRTAGISCNRHDIAVESLTTISGLDTPLWTAHDQWWSERVALAQRHGKKLVYIARYSADVCAVALEEVDACSPFYSLQAVENCVLINSRLYADIPLCVKGPGAGIEVTAAGVLNDCIDAARALQRRTQTLSLALAA